MNIDSVETFLAVVRLGNLNTAARELHVTQSTVTARLNSLEQELGASLLVRSRKGARLTKAGFRFHDQAELIVRTWSNAQAQFALPAGVTSVLSIGCDPTVWTCHGTQLLERVRSRHPETAVELWVATTALARSWLDSGLCDVALLHEPLVGLQTQSALYSTDRLLQYSTVDRGIMEWDPDYIYVDYGPAFRTLHAENFGTAETATTSFGHPDWALQFLLDHRGSAYLPESLAQPEVTRGALHPVRGAPVFSNDVHLSWTEPADRAFPWISQLVGSA